MPVVGEFFAQQHEVPRREAANMIADESGPLPGREQRQLHGQVVMPMLSLAVNRNPLTRSDDHVDFAQGPAPSQDAKGMTARRVDRFAVASHGSLLRSGRARET